MALTVFTFEVDVDLEAGYAYPPEDYAEELARAIEQTFRMMWGVRGVYPVID